MNGRRPRRDPFAVVRVSGRAGRPRILRGERGGGPVTGPDEAAAARSEPQRRREAPSRFVLVAPDLVNGRLAPADRRAFEAARDLAQDRPDWAIAAVAFGPAPEGLEAEGCDRVLALPLAEDHPSARCAVLTAFIAAMDVQHVVLPDTAWCGGELGRRVAAALDTPPATGVLRIAGGEVFRRGPDEQELVAAAPLVVLVAADYAGAVRAVRGEARDLSWRPPGEASPEFRDLGWTSPDPETVPIAQADVILSGGAGVSDWDGLRRLGRVLRLPVAGSRVAVDAGRLPRNRQIGATGAIVQARGYLAFGISGAPQHLEGIRACESVAAVNQDPSCPMMARADLAIVGDASAVIAALLRRLESSGDD